MTYETNNTAQVGGKAPNFELTGVYNKQFNTYTLPNTNGRWTMLLFYPLDFTFVCPTEVIAFSDNASRFKELGVDVYGVSVDSQFTHLAWTETPRNQGGVGDLNFPLLADLNKTVSEQFGVLRDGVALRGLFLIDDEGVVQHATINNLGVGRNVEETLRLVQAFQHTKKSGEVCPANWTPDAATMKPDTTGLKTYAQKTYK
jgi:peroxiredoxin (alkyl hydroperoxide reductase subunit C)